VAEMTPVASVSVIVATLDRPAALARCLDALLAGRRLPAEIIVVDQGPERLARCELEARCACGVPLIHIPQARQGLSAARNTGLTNSRYPVVAVTDDDCIPDPAWIENIERIFEQPNPPDAVTGRVLPLGPETTSSYAVSLRERAVRKIYSSRSLPWLVGSGGNQALGRQWYFRVGGYDERLGAGSSGQAAEDTDFFYRLLRMGARIRYDPDVVVFHERQDATHRLSSRRKYGHGIGAFCALRLRQKDLYGLYILARWVLSQLRMLFGALVGQDAFLVRQFVLSLRGTMAGLTYGWRVPGPMPAEGGRKPGLDASDSTEGPRQPLTP
jgi:glycosyltransferase involved in cell wall biosynthesis